MRLTTTGMLILVWLVFAGTLLAQRTQPRKKTSGRQLQLEVLKSRFANFADGQFWSRELAKSGYSLRISTRRADQDAEVTEEKLGGVQFVKVVGLLETDGSILFPDRKFKRNEIKKLTKWLDELKEFGPRGSPEGKKVWGLDRQQFEVLVKTLSKKIETDLAGKTFDECLAALPAPDKLPYRWTKEATALRNQIDPTNTFPEWQRTQGITQGITLCAVLQHYGLGFWPERQPDGSIELVIEPIASGKKLWWLGFETEISPGMIAPRFLRRTEVGVLQDVPLLELAQVISVQSETPMVFDTYNIDRAKIDLQNAKVSHPAGKKNWSLILSRILFQHKLTQQLMIDEAGRAFVLVKPRATVLKQLEEKQ